MFRFKQFSVVQEQSAMKVCTDSCMFGAWVALRVQSEQRILDIGTGTGLLSLMVAQGSQAFFDAIEIDIAAKEEAALNFRSSPFDQRLTAINADARRFQSPGSYNRIISNPPFFRNQLRSPSARENLAKHSAELTFDELLSCVDRNLAPAGTFNVLISYETETEFLRLAETAGFYCCEIVRIKKIAGGGFFRSMLELKKSPCEMEVGEITIRAQDGDYTDEFKKLLAPYYLRL